MRKEQKAADREAQIKKAKEDKAMQDDELEQVMNLKKNMDEMQSDDSDDDRDGNDSDSEDKKEKLKLSKKSKAIKKQERHRSDDADFIKNLARIAASKKIEKKAQDAEVGIDITPKVAFNKKTMQKIQKQKLENHKKNLEMGEEVVPVESRLHEIKNEKILKEEPRFRTQLRAKIEKKKKINLKNLNTIKVKRMVN